MGEENLETYMVYGDRKVKLGEIVDVKCSDIKENFFSISETGISEEDKEFLRETVHDIAGMFRGAELSGTVEYKITGHRVSRKRYVKLMMSSGLDRNTANWHADLCRLLTGHYYIKEVLR